MNRRISRILISIIIITCQACHFGAGLIEADLTDNFSLFANNSIDELSIWYFPGENGSKLIVRATVFAVGNNDEFIIAKSHPKGSENRIDKNVTLYHIIEVEKIKINPEESRGMTLEEFESTRRKLNIPASLDFTKVYKELE
jgi:hypothetical protein